MEPWAPSARNDVVTLSKIEKMKAIHNKSDLRMLKEADVVTLSKIEKMKAIHNRGLNTPELPGDVVTLSKIEKMKAIHNSHSSAMMDMKML